MAKIFFAGNAAIEENITNEDFAVKCFLCNKSFSEVKEDTYNIFDERGPAGDQECSVSAIFASVFSREITEESVHSKFLCNSCYLLILEYEAIEQRYFQIKYKIIEEYNKTAKIYGHDIVDFEIAVQEIHNLENFNGTEDKTNDTDTEQDVAQVDPSLINYFTIKTLEHTYDIPEENYVEKSNDVDDSGEDCTENIVNIITEVVEDQSMQVSEDQQDNVDEEIDFEELESDTKDDLFLPRTEDMNEHNETNKDIGNTKYITTDNSRPSFQFDGEKFLCLCCKENENDTHYNVRSIGTHLKTMHNIKIFVCEFCGKGYGKRNELAEHIDLEHSTNLNDAFRCEICLRIFTNLRLLKIHRRIHYNVTKTFECPVCTKKYSSKNLLDEHMNMHTGERPFKCEECSKDFASKYTLNAHLKIHLNRPRPYSCNNCSKSFFSAQNLQQHQKTHLGIKEFVCDVCQKAFGTQHNLDVHKVVHTGYKPFICRTCGKAFARRAEIRDHERTHTGEKPFSCETCGVSFAQRSNLTTHKRATHLNDKRYKCSDCGRSFKRRRLLDYHIRASHTGERPYKCDVCNSSFVYPEHYKKHLKLHTGEKPYSCEVCSKKFNSRDNRNAHRFIHSNKKPYECLVCGLGFMRKPALYNHMQSMGHLNDSIVINKPQIENSTDDKFQETLVQVYVSSESMIVDEKSTDIILEEEHLVDPIDNDSESFKDDDDDDNVRNDIIEEDHIITTLDEEDESIIPEILHSSIKNDIDTDEENFIQIFK